MAFSFSFGGVRSEYKDIIINKVKRNIAPPINTRSMSVPNRDGIYFYRNDLGSKTVEFDITVEDTSQPNLRKTVERIATFLEPKNGLQELIVDDETDRLYYAILSNDTSFDQLLSFGKTTLVFLVPDGVSHSTSSLTHFVSQEPAAVFTRASTAYTRDLTGLGFVEKDNNVPRYETCAYTKGIYVEEHTTNLLTAITSMANGSSQFTTIGTGTTIATTRSYAIVNLLTLRLRTPGLTSPEGTSIAAVAITAGLSYTFSVYLRGHGTVKLQSLENDGGATTTDSVDLTLNQNAYQRLELTFTAQAGTTTVVLKILTTSRQSVEVYFDALQLERKAYSSSWTKGGLTRAVEFLKVKTTNKLNGQQGTIDFFFKKVSSPSTFGAFFDWGLFSAGPTVDRIAISHGTGFGSGIDVVRMEISNTGLQQKILTLDTNVNLVIGRPYYLAARWYLVGSAQGMVKLTLVDLENNTSYQITEATTINAPKMTAFSSGFVGSVTNSTAYRVNAVYEDLRFSPIIRNDTDIDDSWKLRKPLLKDTDASVKYTWNETLYGTLVSNEGSAYGYPIITFHQTLASTHIYLDIYPTTSRFEYLTTDGSFFDSFQINTSGAYMNNFFGSTNNTNDEMTAQSQFPVLTGDHYFLSNDTAAQITLEYTPRWL